MTDASRELLQLADAWEACARRVEESIPDRAAVYRLCAKDLRLASRSSQQAAEPVASLAEEWGDERIDRIAELTIKGMEDGIRGFMKTWGWQQFARNLLEVAAHPSPREAALEKALREIAWSNDSKWQADLARAALAVEGK